MPTILHLITGLEAGGAERMLVRLAGATDRDRFRSVDSDARRRRHRASMGSCSA